MASLIVGHFMIIPLLSPHLVHNVGLPEKQLFLVYLVGGVCSVFSAPLVGKLADRLGLVRVFTALAIIACTVVVLLANAGPLPLWAVLALSGLFFMFASGRFVPGQAIMSLAVPPSHRGAFMSLTSCTRDLAAGLTSSFGGWVVTESPTTGRLLHFDVLGWVAVAAGVLSLWLVRRVRVVEKGPVAVDPI
jgi:predicted MFS family arabinose efflux permease